MKHAGKAKREGIRLLGKSFAWLVLLVVVGLLAQAIEGFLTAATTTLAALWVLFAVFCLNFFRDPDPIVPSASQAIVSPAHGKVDVIDETAESEFLGGPCRRVSIFLSVFDVHVQNAPVAGRIAFFKVTPGKFINAMKPEASLQNENLLIGFESGEQSGEKIGVRLIAGLLARRIVPWIALHDVVQRGERTSLIRFGSRVDLYLPLSAKVAVRLGDRVKGGETLIATRG